jgi:hypothetical protein
MRKEEICIKERWEVKRNSVQLEEEEGLIRYRGIWRRKEEDNMGRLEKICTVGRGEGGKNSVQWEEEGEGRILYKGKMGR